MIRNISISGFLLILAASIGRGVPAVPLYMPTPKAPAIAKPVVALDLRGTAWLGKYSTIARIFIFEADGTLSYKTTGKIHYKNRGTWRVEGDTLIFEHWLSNPANKIMDFRGTIRDANSIVGESTMKTGAKTMQTLQRTAVGN